MPWEAFLLRFIAGTNKANRIVTTPSMIASAIFDTMPVPNQRMTIGAKAIFGTLLIATMNGSITRATNGEYQSASPQTEVERG